MGVKIQNIKQETIDKISVLAKEYKKTWKEELWDSEDSEIFGLNEFIGGKAEAFEECLEILKHKGDPINKTT